MAILQNTPFGVQPSTAPNLAAAVGFLPLANGATKAVFSAADQGTTSLTLIDAQDLSIAVASAGRYAVTAALAITASGGGSGVALGGTAVAANTLAFIRLSNSSAANAVSIRQTSLGSDPGAALLIAALDYTIDGVVEVTTGGTITVKFKAVSAGTATLLRGSYLTATRIP